MLRLLFVLWTVMSCGLGWAQDTAPPEPSCQPRIVALQSAKAQAKGPPPEASSLDWTDVQPMDDWSHRWPGYDGAAWYRIDWESPCGRSQPQALAVLHMMMAGEVFVNSELIWRDQSLVEPLSRSWNMPRYWLLPQALLKEQGNSIWIRIHGLSSQTPGLGILRIGHPEELQQWTQQATWNSRTIYLICLTVSTVLCLLFAFAWIHNHHQKVYGWYALNLACWSLFISFILMTDPWPFRSTLGVARGSLLSFIAFTYTFCIFTLRFAELRFPRLERSLILIFSACAIFTVAVPDARIDRLQGIWVSMLGICFLVCLLFPLRAFQTHKPSHIIFSACFVLYLIIGIHDMALMHHALDQQVPLTPYTTLLSMLAIAWMLGRQIVHNMRLIERFNHELSLNVTQACDSLSQTLEREHHLALSHSRLQERLQISQDLHDGLGGSLVRSIALVEQTATPLPNSQVLSMLKLMRDDLRQMIDAGTSTSVQVPETPAQWMAPLRHRFSRLFEELSIRVRWSMPPQWYTVPSPIQCLTLTRVLEEALTNIIKHSQAQNVLVEMKLEQADELILLISDDGIGFDVHTVQTHSMGVGMRSMLARMERVSGSFQLQSQPSGTTLTAIMSLGRVHTSAATASSSSCSSQPEGCTDRIY